MLNGIFPGEIDVCGLTSFCRDTERFERSPTIGKRTVESFDVLVQFITFEFQLFGNFNPVVTVYVTIVEPVVLHLLKELAALCLFAV